MATRIRVTIEDIGTGAAPDPDVVELTREIECTGAELGRYVTATADAAHIAFTSGRPESLPF